MISFNENKNTVQDLITLYHNPGLVKPGDSPNGNWIYHIYSNGEITHQKGGFAYLMRTEFVEKTPVYMSSNKNIKFPINISNYSYAIVTKEHANEIRDAMVSTQFNN